MTSYNVDSIVDELINILYNTKQYSCLDDVLNKIHSDDIVVFIKKYRKKSKVQNILKDDNFGINVSLIDALVHLRIDFREKRKLLEKIKTLFVKKVESLGGDASFLSTEFFYEMDKSLQCIYGHIDVSDAIFYIKRFLKFCKFPKDFSLMIYRSLVKIFNLFRSSELNKIIYKFFGIIKQLESINSANEKNTVMTLSENDKKAIRYFVEGHYAEEFNVKSDDVFGNGCFDNNALQMTGNCWVHAGINSLLVSLKGKQYLNNLIVKNKISGAISVYLPIAKEYALPNPNCDGIYTFSEKEIYEASLNTSFGDGDYTAMVLAIENFRKQKSNDFDLTSERGNASEIFSLFFGRKYTARNISVCENNLESLLKIFNSKKYAIYVAAAVGMELAHSFKNKTEILTGEHALSIDSIDIKDKNIILKDSRCPNHPVKVKMNEFFEKSTLWYSPIPD